MAKKKQPSRRRSRGLKKPDRVSDEGCDAMLASSIDMISERIEAMREALAAEREAH